jgi:integrase
MRKVTPYEAQGTTLYRVRYRSGGRERAVSFHRKDDGETFASILGNGRGERVSEALAWLAAKESDRETQTFEQWFEVYLRSLSGVTSRTVDDYRAIHRRYLADLDPLPLELITRIHVADLVNDLDRRKLSPKTIKNVVHMLSSVMVLAMDEGHIDRNPVRRVRLPKAIADDDAAPKFLTVEEAGALIAATPEHYQPLVTFLFGTGLRWSEATALQSRHVDLDAGTVRVLRAWKRVPGGWEIGPPKSAKSKRTVNAAVDALVAVEPLLGKPSDLVFTTPRGNVVRHANFYNRIWVPACEKAGLDPRPSPHDCRHSFASWMLSSGTVGLEGVQDQLGHESYDTTRKVYGHLLPAVGVAAGKAASEAMRLVLAHRAQLTALTALEAARQPHE